MHFYCSQPVPRRRNSQFPAAVRRQQTQVLGTTRTAAWGQRQWWWTQLTQPTPDDASPILPHVGVGVLQAQALQLPWATGSALGGLRELRVSGGTSCPPCYAACTCLLHQRLMLKLKMVFECIYCAKPLQWHRKQTRLLQPSSPVSHSWKGPLATWPSRRTWSRGTATVPGLFVACVHRVHRATRQGLSAVASIPPTGASPVVAAVLLMQPAAGALQATP